MRSSIRRPQFVALVTLLLVASPMVAAAISFGGGCDRYVATHGSDGGSGSESDPWATITQAAEQTPDDDCTIWVADGVYRGSSDITRRFATSLTVAAASQHGAILEGAGLVLDIDGARNVTVDGFEVRHRPGGHGIVLNISGSGSTFAEGITLINNIVHDSFDNDLIKINAGVRDTVVANTITFNPGPGEQHYDINGVEDVTLRNNIMFNDYAGSGRAVEDVKHFIIIKDSNSSGLDLHGSKRVTVDGNVFIGWENTGGEFMVKAGNDGKPYYEAIDVTVENNLFLSNGPDIARTVFGGAGVKNVIFRNNTINHTTAKYQGYVFESKGDNPINDGVTVCNNVWSAEMNDFASVSGTRGLVERGNIYWNGGAPVPGFTTGSGTVADPGLAHGRVTRPRSGDAAVWLRNLVAAHGTPGTAVVDAADAACASSHDILGRGRGTSPDAGALEVSGAGTPPDTTLPPSTTAPPSSTTPPSTTPPSTTLPPADSYLLVPAEYPTIQDAVDAATVGEVVLVARGIYRENVVIGTPGVTVASEYLTSGDPSAIDDTVIDGGGGASVVHIRPSAGEDTSIVGLTLRNAEDGVFAQAKLKFLHNVVRDTSDGIDYDSNAPGAPSGGVVRASLFEANSDDAIDLDDEVSVIIEGNVLRNNGDDGIEIRLHDYRGPMLEIVIRDNVITGNGEDGIQLIDDEALSDRTFRIEGNLIADNRDAGLGMMPNMVTREDFGGADLAELVVVANNTIVDNDHGVTGGDNLIMVNNVVAKNTNVGLKRSRVDSVATYNLFYGNGTNFQDAIVEMATTSIVDPLLQADYRLADVSPAIDAGTAHLTANGSTIIDLGPDDYHGTAPDLGAYEASSAAANGPPNVHAGPDMTIRPDEPATLAASVSDDGLPNPPGAVTVQWTVTDGPGAVVFSDPTAVTTDADFSATGTYTLRITGHDSALTGHDELTVTVASSAPNAAPTVDAGSELLVDLSAPAALRGSVTDDGWPDPPGTFTSNWTVVGGPGAVSFEDATHPATEAHFSQAGTYLLRLSADDGAATAHDEIIVTVRAVPPGATVVIEVAVGSRADDAVENGKGRISLNRDVLNLVRRNTTVGLRFDSVDIPVGATIVEAHVQFTSYQASRGTARLRIGGEAAANAGEFDRTRYGISSRVRTEAEVEWQPPRWMRRGQSKVAQQTPDITEIVQQIVDGKRWLPGNALVLLINGSGKRLAAAYDGQPEAAAVLHITYTLDGP